MKEFDCIMSGQLDNPSSSVDSYLSDDIDEPDLQQTLIEESRQRYLNRMRLMRFKCLCRDSSIRVCCRSGSSLSSLK